MKDNELHTARLRIKSALIAARSAVANAEKALESGPTAASRLIAIVSVLGESIEKDALQAEAYFYQSRSYIEENRAEEQDD